MIVCGTCAAESGLRLPPASRWHMHLPHILLSLIPSPLCGALPLPTHLPLPPCAVAQLCARLHSAQLIAARRRLAVVVAARQHYAKAEAGLLLVRKHLLGRLLGRLCDGGLLVRLRQLVVVVVVIGAGSGAARLRPL